MAFSKLAPPFRGLTQRSVVSFHARRVAPAAGALAFQKRNVSMTTEEAFVKMLQKHGIDNAFGIIGSAMMPISDLFPAAGIKFWDCAHEYTAGMMSDGYSRS